MILKLQLRGAKYEFFASLYLEASLSFKFLIANLVEGSLTILDKPPSILSFKFMFSLKATNLAS